MANLKQVKTRVATAHTALAKAAALLTVIEPEDPAHRYMEREIVKVCGRLEGVLAIIDHSDSTNEADRP
jgi:hypothetical protein